MSNTDSAGMAHTVADLDFEQNHRRPLAKPEDRNFPIRRSCRDELSKALLADENLERHP